MSESEKCCFCIPLDIGVKILATVIIIGTALSVINSTFLEENGWEFWWHLNTVQLIMSLFWIIALAKPQVETKKAAFWAYLVLITFGANIIYSYLIFSGDLASHLCVT